MDLSGKKYSDLQKLAKNLGIKANIKMDKLKQAIEEFYSSQDKDLSGGISNEKKHEYFNDANICKKQRRSTFEKKDTILTKKPVTTKAQAATKGLGTKIPKFKSSQQKTPRTKDWTKIHKRHFDKMDSLDVYLEKKNKRAMEISGKTDDKQDTLKKARVALNMHLNYETPEAVRSVRASAKSKLFPTPVSRSNAPTAVFKPMVLSTRNINFNFAGESKVPIFNAGPKIVKPVVCRRVSPRLRTTATPKKSGIANKTIKNMESFKKENVPSKRDSFTYQKTNSARKPSAFNLKESLARPLTWVPYTGKLKPLEKQNEIMSSSKKFTAPTLKNEVSIAKQLQKDKIKQIRANKSGLKAPSRIIRVEQRTQSMKNRSNRQFEEIMNRRGLNC